MFRAISCSSPGGQIVLTQHLVSSPSVNDRPVHRLRKNLKNLCIKFVIVWSYTKMHGQRNINISNGFIKMKQNRCLNKSNGLLAKMESSYVTTCFGLHLWPSSDYNLLALLHLLSIRSYPHDTQQPSCTLFPSSWANQDSALHTVLHNMYTRFIRLNCRFSDDWDIIINLHLRILYKNHECGSLSPRHGASSGCGWGNGLLYGG
jgi:hypothetical protein